MNIFKANFNYKTKIKGLFYCQYFDGPQIQLSHKFELHFTALVMTSENWKGNIEWSIVK